MNYMNDWDIEEDQTPRQPATPAPVAAAGWHITAPLGATPPAPAQRRAGRGAQLLTLLVLGLGAGGAGGAATVWTLDQTLARPAVTSTAPITTAAQPVVNDQASAITSLYQQVAGEVVSVQTTVGGGRFAGSGEGTGIVLDSGHVLTNYHVVEGATSIAIVLQDGTRITATVAGSAPADDLALLAATLPADKVHPATLGDSDSAQIGEEVIAVGNPFGLDHTVTAGIISAVNRQWSSGSGPTQTYLQTDTAINPGNSGGPLFDLQGNVIGINTAIESPVQGSVGIGFAIPINRAKSLLTQLGSGSTVQKAWLGISGLALDADTAQQLSAPVSTGVLVTGVIADGPAAQAGLQGADPTTSTQLGDIITAVDKVTVSQVADISNYLATKQVGDAVTLAILRNGQPQTVQVTLGAWPDTSASTTTP
jgi:putative serine protease PepD